MNKFDKYIKEKENIVLQNLSIIAISIIIIIWALFIYQQIFCLLSNFYDINYLPKTITLEFSITTTWAIIAFWYWYKKYERDKDIEMVDRLTRFDICDLKDITNLRLWIKLHDKWYISNFIWEIIDEKYWNIIYSFLKEYIKNRDIDNLSIAIWNFIVGETLIFNYFRIKIDILIEHTEKWGTIFKSEWNTEQEELYSKLKDLFIKIKTIIDGAYKKINNS